MNLTNNQKYLFLIYILFSLSSCSSYKNISYNILKPAEITISPEISSVSLINNIFPTNPDSIAVLTEYPDSMNIKQVASVECFMGLYDNLLESEKYKRIVVPILNFDVVENKIDWETLKKICSFDTTDAVIIIYDIEHFIFSNYDVDYIDETNRADNNIFYTEYLFVKITSSWMFINPFNKTVINFSTISDTITWSGKENNFGQTIEDLSDTNSAILKVANYNGMHYCKRISPYWKSVTQEIYVGNNTDFIKAYHLADSNNWKAAAEIWEKYVNYPNVKIAKNARLNLAISYEMRGILWKARLWTLRTYREFKNERAFEYSNYLFNRIKDMEKIKKQMP